MSAGVTNQTRVLIVEDDPGYARFLEEVLREVEGDGYVVSSAGTVEDALGSLGSGTFDVVLLDLGLPDADGTEALSRVYEQASQTPIVVLSALNDLNVALESMRLGAQDYLVKGEFEHALLPRAIRYAIERKRLQEGMSAARAEAERANAVKDDFFAMLGHELRNPLAPIVTALNVLERKGGAGIDRELTILRRQVQHVVRLVDDLLDVARIARGKVELHRENVDVADVVEAGVETAAPLIEERQHSLSVEAPRGTCFIHGDASRLAQVVANLLTNAAKYTNVGGKIRVSVARNDGFVEIAVGDNGVGMDQELIERVFEVFAQGKRTLDRSAGGWGLGLAIVRNLVSLHGGSVSAHSDGPGKGSEFRARFPLRNDSASTAAPRERAQSEPPQARAPKRRVLVVDDNADGAELLELALQTLGHDTRVAHDGPEALAAAKDFLPDVALLDIGLPGMNGYELARAMRDLLGDSTPVLVAVTGYGQDSDRKRSSAAGFAHHLVKPIDLEGVGALIASLKEPSQGPPNQ
jgi:signal transduction histidine kinase